MLAENFVGNFFNPLFGTKWDAVLPLKSIDSGEVGPFWPSFWIDLGLVAILLWAYKAATVALNLRYPARRSPFTIVFAPFDRANASLSTMILQTTGREVRFRYDDGAVAGSFTSTRIAVMLSLPPRSLAISMKRCTAVSAPRKVTIEISSCRR